jgi:Tfp pilus assembly protein PilE
MSRRKIFVVLVSAAVFVAVLLCVVWKAEQYIHRKELKNGRYVIQNNEEFSDAYILIKNGKAQFCNIDLNVLYQKGYADEYVKRIKNQDGNLSKEDEKELAKSIDLNKIFVNQPWKLDYDSFNLTAQGKEEEYRFGKVFRGVYFGCTYDYKTETVDISGFHDENEIIFKLEDQ